LVNRIGSSGADVEIKLDGIVNLAASDFIV
jgi:hypothetical protein